MIYIIRHGQTLWNLQGKKQGRNDSPLTLKGISQANNVAKILLEEKIDLNNFTVVSSPQWRCRQFLSIICEQIEFDYNKCIFEDNLREHAFGMWEGLTEEQIKEQYGEIYKKRELSKWDFIAPMGESYDLVHKRVAKVLEKYEEQNIIFVCHEMISKVLRGKMLELDKKEIMSLKHRQDVVYKIENKTLKELT